jgi:predicted nucleic acid-binding protein
LIVIDASATIALLLNEDSVATTIENFHALAKDAVIVPSHWAAEVGNSLVTNIRRNRLELHELAYAITRLEALGIVIEPPPTFTEMTAIAEMAMQAGLTYYDAAYVHMALTRQASLFTLDGKMRNAAARANVPVLQ